MHYRFFGLKYLTHLGNLVEKKRIAHLGFLYLRETENQLNMALGLIIQE